MTRLSANKQPIIIIVQATVALHVQENRKYANLSKIVFQTVGTQFKKIFGFVNHNDSRSAVQFLQERVISFPVEASQFMRVAIRWDFTSRAVESSVKSAVVQAGQLISA